MREILGPSESLPNPHDDPVSEELLSLFGGLGNPRLGEIMRLAQDNGQKTKSQDLRPAVSASQTPLNSFPVFSLITLDKDYREL